MDMKEVIINLIKKASNELDLNLELKDEDLINAIEIPPNTSLGDFAFPCFLIAKVTKSDPHDLALQLKAKIENKGEFESIETKGPYINFFLNRKILSVGVVREILSKRDKYGSSLIGKGKKIIVEFSSPNIAKPFHVGHLRSTIIGNSISNISKFMGFKVIKINYLGDWGTQFGRLLVGYHNFGNEKKLKINPMNHLLDIYIKANKKKYDEDARVFFKSLENGDKASLRLWKTFRDLSIKEFDAFYKKLGIEFDVYHGESMYNNTINEINKLLEKKSLLEKSQGAYIVNLKKYNLDVALIIKKDGTTLYTTRDLAAAIDRYSRYKFDQMIYEVGQEQQLHFSQMFKILELMGYKWAKNCIHIGHGLYLNAKGKRFSTRKGKTIFMNDILNETIKLAERGIRKKDKEISKNELEKRALKVAIGAIFYGDLKNNRTNDIVFDLKRFVDFEGNTGPYLQYSYARATSILSKMNIGLKNKIKIPYEIKEINEKETALIKKLMEFPDVVNKSYSALSPSLIANYAYHLAQIFNEFYHSCPVLQEADLIQQNFRLTLVDSFRQVLKNSLSLLGIEVLEKM